MHNLRTTGNLLSDPGPQDSIFKKDMLDFLLLLAVPEENKARLVEGGVLEALLVQLDLSSAPIQRVLQSLKCLVLLAEHPPNCSAMMHAGLLSRLKRVCFEQLPLMGKENRTNCTAAAGTKRNRNRIQSNNFMIGLRRRAETHKPNNNQRKEGGGRARTPRQEMLRSTMHLLVSLVADERHRDTFLESGLLEHLLDPSFAAHLDRKVRRPVGKILIQLADVGGDSSPRHMNMVAMGALQTILIFLTGRYV